MKLLALLAPYKAYLVLGLIAGLMLTTGVFVWRYKSAVAEQEKIEAVGKAMADAQAQIDEAARVADHYRELADVKYAELMGKLGKLRVEHTIINNTIQQDIAENREFYKQPLPLKGWEQWLKAQSIYNRAVMPATPASAP